MAKKVKKAKNEAKKEDKKVTVAVYGVEVTQHLDRDPNDPRNVEPAGSLPSLDD